MLKRNDLAKQFELVVQQEITNFNNSLTNIYSLIGELKREVEDVKQLYNAGHAALSSRSKSAEVSHKSLSDSLDVLRQKHESFVNDQRVINKAHADEFFDISQIVTRKIDIDNRFNEKLTTLHGEILKVRSNVDQSTQALANSINDLHRLLKKDMLALKDEILSMPSEAKFVKKQLEEKIDSHVLDVRGVLKEILISKKETHILEKKIENLYTLFERLKKAEALS